MVNGDWISGILSSLAQLDALFGGRQVVGNYLLAVSLKKKNNLLFWNTFKTHKELGK